ncbi:MAG: cyanophycinase [Trueperaceae bacterium]|nr:cyanophycinase [Trueperaceae bacterium]
MNTNIGRYGALALLLGTSGLGLAQSLVAIGGGLEPDNEPIYREIIDLAGADPLVCVYGVASADPEESAASYERDFVGYGASAVVVDITVDNAAESTSSDEVVATIEGCNAHFFVGGDQRRITEALLSDDGSDTLAMAALRRGYLEGNVVAGTSAGAAALSAVMISGGSSLDTLLGEGEVVELQAGLGFVGNVILDQHFIERGRFGRLVGALATAELPLGAGVGENTALVIPADGLWYVVGEGHVGLIEATATTTDSEIGGTTISLLSNGDRFDPASGTISILPQRENTQDVGLYYGEGDIFAVDIFGPDVLADVLTQLVDSPEMQASGLGFRGGGELPFSSDGVRVVFDKTDDTAGYWGRVDSGANYSVVRVRMGLEPITVSTTFQEDETDDQTSV